VWCDKEGILEINDIKNVVEGHVPVAAADSEVATAAERYRHLQGLSTAALAVCVLSLGIAGGAYALRGIRADLRARNRVEAVIRGFLILRAYPIRASAACNRAAS
jgi:phosphate transport system permease protein